MLVSEYPLSFITTANRLWLVVIDMHINVATDNMMKDAKLNGLLKFAEGLDRVIVQIPGQIELSKKRGRSICSFFSSQFPTKPSGRLQQ